ncbi:FAD-dependent oxidoreductase [Mycobacterium gallinarum]|uniref:FAD-dependent oxidoreductase n=1 Tax=Mycobacterium gallinarum TaxID=39689 RepID=A0A9W4B5Q2_9MYCO|nr:FAD-dependent oxidoreductase [Mycobacterium gallinarum]BBY94357.1 FAD-dependent oxidoreductase [Mycobacterium gallinarum]
MTSLWLADAAESAGTPRDEILRDASDVVVVGAGITGLTTAVLLARAGKRVTVVEAQYVGAGATGNTTGKVSLLQGTKLSRIAKKHGQEVLRDYVTGNTEGREWLLRYCEEHGLDVQREDDYAYAQAADGVDTARSVLSAARAAGLDSAEWVEQADVPFPFRGGVRLPDQAQIDPMPFLNRLVTELETHGGTLLQGVRVTSISGTGPLQVSVQLPETSEQQQVSLTAQQVVLATGIPILDRGGFFARVKPQRSYCLAFDVPGDITRSMFLSVDSPTRSVRYAPTAGGEKLVVGGAGHTVGRADSAAAGIEELTKWAVLHYPGAVRTHVWSAQDYTPIDELPYVGPLLPKFDRIFVATGFDKWGMSNGVAAALALSSQMLGGRMDWRRAFASWSPHEAAGLATALMSNLEVGFNLAKGWVTPIVASTATPSEGDGVVTGPPWHLRAQSTVNGETHVVSPVCPHLGGIVSWNDADCTWECPLHGSRFAPDGSLLEGPATKSLTA